MPLRLNDRSQIGREIDCPDCGSRLLIVADAGEVRAQRAVGARGLELPRRSGSKMTLRLIWLATVCLGGLVVWLAARPDAASSITVKKPPQPVVVEESSTVSAPVVNATTPPAVT
ncbi:MAG TPA: hypothetical protein VM510_06640, partial [Caulifigura sp.]|nr:hypothetical protein [Caulifigura sp.]